MKRYSSKHTYENCHFNEVINTMKEGLVCSWYLSILLHWCVPKGMTVLSKWNGPRVKITITDTMTFKDFYSAARFAERRKILGEVFSPFYQRQLLLPKLSPILLPHPRKSLTFYCLLANLRYRCIERDALVPPIKSVPSTKVLPQTVSISHTSPELPAVSHTTSGAYADRGTLWSLPSNSASVI